jgi:hypothetical protein
MSAKRYEDNEVNNNASNQNDMKNGISLNCKLERRRRIEDLNEERKLQHEMNDYY